MWPQATGRAESASQMVTDLKVEKITSVHYVRGGGILLHVRIHRRGINNQSICLFSGDDMMAARAGERGGDFKRKMMTYSMSRCLQQSGWRRCATEADDPARSATTRTRRACGSSTVVLL